MRGDPKLEAQCDHPCFLDEESCGGRRTEVPSRGFEQVQPAVEVLGIDGQGRVRLHRPPVVAACHQHDRRPEGAHARKMRRPVGYAGVEHRTQQGVGAHAIVKGVYQEMNHIFVDAGARRDVRRERGPSCGAIVLLAVDGLVGCANRAPNSVLSMRIMMGIIGIYNTY